jgi:hypothetical protein
MKISGLKGTLEVKTNAPSISLRGDGKTLFEPSEHSDLDLQEPAIYYWVEDGKGNELFRTDKGADVAIQWAIDNV